MDMSRFDSADNVITIRISQREYDELYKWVIEDNTRTYRYRNKTTISRLVRQMIRHCINKKGDLSNIMYE